MLQKKHVFRGSESAAELKIKNKQNRKKIKIWELETRGVVGSGR